MKYLLLLCDGMSDLPVEELSGDTPMDRASKPVMDSLISKSYAGMVRTIPLSLPAGSDTANMSVMGFDPVKYYTGRSPIEAISMGIDMHEDDIAFRVNLVTLKNPDSSQNSPDDNSRSLSDSLSAAVDLKEYETSIMADYSSDEITSQESKKLIDTINEAFATESLRFYPGKSYRHCMIWHKGQLEGDLTPPHDILEQSIQNYLPKEHAFEPLKDIMTRSHHVLKSHPVNIKRVKEGLNPANSVWIWGQGKKTYLPSITLEYNLKSSVISAVDLVFGLGIAAGMDPIHVEGANGTITTNFKGKGEAAVKEFVRGQDYIYLHVEAPDECGHRNEIENKILSIEKIDQEILKPIIEYLKKNKNETGEEYRIMVLPDHPTPLSLRTHTHDPVPFFIYTSEGEVNSGINTYTEKECAKTGIFFEKGHELFDFFIRGNFLNFNL